MHSRKFIVGITVFLSATAVVSAQTPTPTAVVSNIAVEAYAQSRGEDLSGVPCTTRGATGCGGCYPEPIPPADPIAAALAQLNLVNPEWQPVGPMIPGGDTSLPPASIPIRVDATVALSKSPGDDFPATHLSSDYNAELIPDNHGLLATGDVNRPDDQRLEFEWEGDKLPMYMWSGEGDRLTAEGRWIFDCGHADPSPQGKCSNSASTVCNVDGDCPAGGTCTTPVPTFNYQSELHPPHAVAVLRNKSQGASPATRADVYISNDAGGAGDRCTVTHLPAATDVLFNKACFLNHCSVTTARSCAVDADCAKGETCLRFDPAKRLADINASDFEFDMPLPPKPSGATAVKIVTTKMKVPKGSVMPKAVFETHLTDPTPSIHVTVPMTVPVKGKMPNVFAQSITASWKGDTTKLKHVQVKFTGLTVTNPVKDSIPPVPHVCADPVTGPTTTACAADADCAAGTCAASSKACHANSDCAKTDFCDGAARCIGGITPGWRTWGEVNGDWVEFTGVSQVGTQAPFASPPYMQPGTPPTMKQKFKFDEYVPADGSIHIKVSGRSFNCLNAIFGHNLKELLGYYGFTAGGNCLLNGGSNDPGTVDITLNGPNFGTTGPGSVAVLSQPSGGGDAGTCSVTTNQLCVSSVDCPSGETCTRNGSGYTLQYTVKVFP